MKEKFLRGRTMKRLMTLVLSMVMVVMSLATENIKVYAAKQEANPVKYIEFNVNYSGFSGITEESTYLDILKMVGANFSCVVEGKDNKVEGDMAGISFIVDGMTREYFFDYIDSYTIDRYPILFEAVDMTKLISIEYNVGYAEGCNPMATSSSIEDFVIKLNNQSVDFGIYHSWSQALQGEETVRIETYSDSNNVFHYISIGSIADMKNAAAAVATTPAPAPAPIEMFTVNIDGTTLDSWLAIENAITELSSEKLQEVNENNGDLLHVNIARMEDKTVPVDAVAALKDSAVGGLHVFIGKSDAITFLSKIDYSNYAGVDFSHNDEITDDSRTIDFVNKTKINASVVFHTLVAPKKQVTIYKVVGDKEVEIGKAVSDNDGKLCFRIDETAKYVLKY